ncbi:hypothetical protein FB451DRAFT_1376267 [Mycena latifolia]|nr:hypothetical protein FB451DRAFT_1376267 [Mycena latifolia]
MTSAYHLTEEPRLPTDLEREIFETCALSRPVIVPTLMLVAWRVKNWVEPLLYRIICMAHTPPLDNLGLPHFTSDVLFRLVNERPMSLVGNSMRHLYLWTPPEDGEHGIPRTRHRANINAILPACKGVTSLFIVPGEAQFCSALGDMYSRTLLRLAVDISDLFTRYHEGFAYHLFHNITHLEVFDDEQLLSASMWQELTLVPRLTHLSFWSKVFLDGRAGAILTACPRLQYLAFLSSSPVVNTPVAPACDRLASDSRFVVVVLLDFERDWMRGALTGHDYWARAEAFVAAKRAGEIASSAYQAIEENT